MKLINLNYKYIFVILYTLIFTINVIDSLYMIIILEKRYDFISNSQCLKSNCKDKFISLSSAVVCTMFISIITKILIWFNFKMKFMVMLDFIFSSLYDILMILNVLILFNFTDHLLYISEITSLILLLLLYMCFIVYSVLICTNVLFEFKETPYVYQRYVDNI